MKQKKEEPNKLGDQIPTFSMAQNQHFIVALDMLDEYRMGYIQEQTLRQLFSQDISKKFLCEKEPLSEKCRTCPFLKMCHGGCKRMKDAIYVDERNFCGYAHLLKEFVPKIDEILGTLQELHV